MTSPAAGQVVYFKSVLRKVSCGIKIAWRGGTEITMNIEEKLNINTSFFCDDQLINIFFEVPAAGFEVDFEFKGGDKYFLLSFLKKEINFFPPAIIS